MKRKPQKQIILDWYKHRKWLSTEQAMHQLFILCPHKRIAELEASGYVFKRERKRVGHALVMNYKLLHGPDGLKAAA